MPSRISLGTVQFGLDYGVANKNGKISREKVFEILKCAHACGIDCLDTAYDYGDSETIIGDYLQQHPDQFQVVSKLPALNEYSQGKAEAFLGLTLCRIGIRKLYGYLIHKFENFLTCEGLWKEFMGLKKRNLADRIGFSLYAPGELEILLEQNIEFDLIQIPCSVFDRRFEKYFGTLKKRGIEIHVRSIFLQGLAFLDPDNLPRNLIGARKNIQNLRNLARDNNVSINVICLNYVRQNLLIDKIVIGVDSPDHLKKNAQIIDISNYFDDVLTNLAINDDDILMPYRWQLEKGNHNR